VRFRFCVAKVGTFFYPTKFFHQIFDFYISCSSYFSISSIYKPARPNKHST